MKPIVPLLVLLVAAACSEATVQPVSQNTFRIATPDAEICGLNRSREIALDMAAVEVLRQGASHFIILSEDSETAFDGVSLERDFDDLLTGISVDTRTEQSLLVRVLRPGDPLFENGLAAQQILGPNWRQTVAEGASTSCFE